MLPTTKLSPQKKMLVAAGIFLIPTVVLIVVIVSLSQRHPKQITPVSSSSVFNKELPSPNLPKGNYNKLEIYMKAQQDSLKTRQERAKDPYVQTGTNITSPLTTLPGIPTNRTAFSPPPDHNVPDANEQKVNERLQKIYAALGQTAPSLKPPPSTTDAPQIDRLERMLGAIQSQDTATNPQLQQVNQVLDKLLSIQHPVASQAIHSDTGHQAIVTDRPPPPQDFPAQSPEIETNAFFGANDEVDSTASAPPPLMAIIPTNQTIVPGAIVKLRLLQDLYINSQRIPANSCIYGPAAINGERITIQLTNVTYDARIFPVSLKVYDAADGLEGLSVPGMITRDVVKENMSQGVSGMNIGALDPSLGAQAAAAGIETARSLLSRKIRLVKVTLKEGHLAILRPMAHNQ